MAPLPWRGDGFREYDNVVTEMTLGRAKSGIKIIHEDIGNQPQFAEAKKLLSEADLACFFGFGYNLMNLDRLDIASACVDTFVIGSVYGLTAPEIDQIKERYPRVVAASSWLK